MSQNEIKKILARYKTVAIVSLSRALGKDSHRVSAYLKYHGFHIIPVNPFADEILGEKSYKNLLHIPPKIQKTIEIVDILRPSKNVTPIVEQAIKLKAACGKPNVVWMQLGIVDKKAAETAKKAGLIVVMDKCMMIEHKHCF